MSDTKKISGAEAVVRCLIEEGANIVYGYPGGAIMPVYDELYKFEKQIHHVLTRHEQGAIHAAQGFARASNRVGVCIATSGPGATNLVTGIADAQIDSTPLVCITGQVPKHLLGTDAFQETDIIGISMSITKWNHQVSKAEDIPDVLSEAFYIAKSGRPGPVLIDITKNAQVDTLNFFYKKTSFVRSYNPYPKVDDTQLIKVSKMINAAKKPLIVFGQGVILGEAEAELKAFVEKTGIPAAWTILGLSALPTDHPLNVGMVGMHGNYAPNMLTNSCDLLLAIGMRFDDRVTGRLEDYAKQAQIIHFEIDPYEVNKNVSVDLAVLGDVKETLGKIEPLLEKKTYPSWLEEFKSYDQVEYDKVIKKDLHPDKDRLTMGEVLKSINVYSGDDAVIVSDVGQHQMIACRYAKFKSSRSNITSGGLGTMGFALPAALGAKMAVPEREVIAIIGDGGFQMTVQELGTIFQFKVPVKIVILNNNFLGMVRQWQEMFFDYRYAHTEMVNPDFIKLAESFFIESKRVTMRSELEQAVREMVQSKTSYLLEVQVEKEDNIFPMISSGSSVSEIRLS